MAQPQTDKSGKIIPRGNGTKDNSLATLLESVKGEIARALPKHVSAERMARICLTALRTTPKLAQCTPASFLGSIMSCAQLGLEPNTPLGHAYLIPRQNKRLGTMECTLQIGYQGMIDIARRGGAVTSIFAYAVRQGDVFEYELGLDPKLRHVPSGAPDRESKPLTHVYAVARLKDTEPVFVVLTKAQVDERRKRSMASSSGPWVTDYEAMALKTSIRVLYRWLPKSIEMAQAAALDEAPELGKSQAAVYDDVTQRVIESEGYQVETDAETEVTADGEPYDPATGEVQTREPGSDG